MAMKYGIFPSMLVGMEDGIPVYDRAVDDKFFTKYHQDFLSNGVYEREGTSFEVVSAGGLSIEIKPGSCQIDGYYAYDEESTFLDIDPIQEDGDYYQIIAIAAELDYSNRQIVLVPKYGNLFETDPQPPILDNNENENKYLVLAYVTIHNKSEEIIDILDTRDNDTICGFAELKIGVEKQLERIAKKWIVASHDEPEGREGSIWLKY